MFAQHDQVEEIDLLMSSSRGRARFGILVPFTNSNLEPDMTLMKPEGVSMHFARMGGYDEDEIPDENQMKGLGTSDIDEPLRLLMGVKPDVILYGCTSATLTHGPEFDHSLAKRIDQTSNTKTVTAAGALVGALRALNVSKIGFASPYVAAINDLAVDFLSTMGIATVAWSEVQDALGNEEQGALTPRSIKELGVKANHDNADALVLSCTDMRSVEIISELEEEIGKPVVTSNQAMMFQALQSIQFKEPISGFGKLLEMDRI